MGIKKKKHESDSRERTGKDGNKALGSFIRNFIKNVTRTFFFFSENEARLAHCRHTFHRISNEKENGTCLSQMWTLCDWMRIILTVVSNSYEKWEDYMNIILIIFQFYIIYIYRIRERGKSRKRKIEKLHSLEKKLYREINFLSISIHLHVDPSFWYDEWSFANNAKFTEHSHECLISCLCGNKIR